MLESTAGSEKQPLGRRRSLVDDARLETAKNREVRLKKELREETKEYDLTEEEIVLLSDQYCEEPDGNEVVSTNLVFSARRELLEDLPSILECIKRHSGDVRHLETRLGTSTEIFVNLSIPRRGLLELIKTTRQGDRTTVAIAGDGRPRPEPRYPRHVSDLDACCHVTAGLQPDLDGSHPGFSDATYRARRLEIAQIALGYKQGDTIPRVDYTDEEIKTWGTVFSELRSLFSKHACSSYRRVFELLEEECGYRPDNIPQLQDVSAFLKKRSGFVLRPAAGLVGARDFLSSLAFRVFQCTQYVRHSSSPDHTPEPDCIHELLGHVPMLADPEFARFSQEIGLASLGASDQDIEKLATVYWFTVEFGLCREKGELKAYGAGLLSSYGELQHALSGSPRLLPFDPDVTSLYPYQDQDFQDVYFVADTFQDAKEKIRNYVRTVIPRRFDIIYDAYTESIQEVDSFLKVESMLESVGTDISILKDALGRLQKNQCIH